MKAKPKTIITGYILVIAIMLAAINLAKAQQPFVGNSYEHLVREIGDPDNTQQLTENIAMVHYSNALDFFYVDAKSRIVVAQVSYLSRRQRARIMKNLTQNLDYRNGWYNNPLHNTRVRVIAEDGQHRIEVIYDVPEYVALMENLIQNRKR